MITLVVPTRNRAHALRLVADSFYAQPLVDEIVFVNDASTDDTNDVVAEVAGRHPNVRTVVLDNGRQMGCPYGRNRGFRAADNEYILYCDDDEYLEPNYASACLAKLNRSDDIGAVAGRRVFKRADQTPDQAVAAFVNGPSARQPYNRVAYESWHGRFSGDVEMPLLTAPFLTRRSLLERFPFDEFYGNGNGYREESSFHMQLFVNGYRLVTTNESHSIHLSRAESATGGHQMRRHRRLYWNIAHTAHFYRRFWPAYSRRVKVRLPTWAAIIYYALYTSWRLYLVPIATVVRRAARRSRSST